MSLTSRIFLIAIFAVSLLGSYGCGSSSNNDQGTSFLARGFVDQATGTPISGVTLPLFVDTSIQGGNATNLGLPADGQLAIAGIVLENRLLVQFIRVVRVDCSYDVQGASIAVPDDSFNFTSVIDPQGVLSAGVDVISPDIFSFINNNQNSFPQLPFRMTVICSAVGVTQAGDVLTTNPVNYFIQFVDIEETFGGGPTVIGAGAGGTINFEGGGTGNLGESEFVTSGSLDGEDAAGDETNTLIGDDSAISDDDSSLISF